MLKNDVAAIKQGHIIRYSYMPDGKIYESEVVHAGNEDGDYVFIEPIIRNESNSESKGFMIMWDEINSVIEPDSKVVRI